MATKHFHKTVTQSSKPAPKGSMNHGAAGPMAGSKPAGKIETSHPAKHLGSNTGPAKVSSASGGATFPSYAPSDPSGTAPNNRNRSSY